MHEVAALLNCLLCDSYFIFVVFAFDNLQSLTLKIGGATSNASAKTGKGGGGGKKSSASDKSTLLEDVYAEISECLYRMRYTLQRCPVRPFPFHHLCCCFGVRAARVRNVTAGVWFRRALKSSAMRNTVLGWMVARNVHSHHASI